MMFGYEYNSRLTKVERQKIIDKVVREFFGRSFYYICY